MSVPHRIYGVLVVDDEQNLREGSQRILARQGYDVELASQGKEALAALAQRPYDVVLLDIRMPGMDGLEVLDRIRERRPDTHVIMVTGFATIETAIEAMKKGAWDFMTKPFRPEQLRLVVGRAIEHIRLKEELDLLEAERAHGLWVITTEKSRLKTVVNAMVAGILILERDKRIVLCNPAFTRMLGVDGDRLPGTYVQDHPLMAVLSEMMDEVLDGRIPGGDVTREFEIQGDRTKYLRATVNTVRTETEKLLGLVAVIRDITSFREQEKEKEAFVAMLTHELRSPLGAVDTQLHVILKGLAGDLSEKQNHMLSRMRERVGNVLAMINDLLDLSKIESRKFAQEKTPMSVEPIIQDVIDLLGPQAQERGQTLDADLPESLPLVSADSHALREVVINLVSNALRYTPAGGRIRVGARADGLFVALTVEDNGLGIPKEYHDKIFERFFRVKDERARSVVGTGLGLPIVKAIVEDHGGALSLQSEVGRGSLFTVRLPVAG